MYRQINKTVRRIQIKTDQQTSVNVNKNVQDYGMICCKRTVYIMNSNESASTENYWHMY